MLFAPPFFLILICLLLGGISIAWAVIVTLRLFLRIKKAKAIGQTYQISTKDKIRLITANTPAILAVGIYGMIDYQSHQYQERKQIQDLYRYATLSTEESYGGITLPIGTRVEYELPHDDTQNNANTKIIAAELPTPIVLNGITVKYISTQWQITVINTEPFTPSALFMDRYDRDDYAAITCPAYSQVRFNIGFERSQQTRGALVLDDWQFESCDEILYFNDAQSYVYVPYWQDGELIKNW